MSLGNKILNLRKNINMTQEQLAEKLDVTRQTISKWELDETVPDIKQAKELSKIFNVSLDEMLDNNIQDVLIEKVSNTEKLAGMVIKILKIIGFLFIGWIVLCVIAFICFTAFRREPISESVIKSATISCSIENNDYLISIGSDSYFNCSNCNEQMQVYLMDITDWANIEHSLKNIRTYFSENGGTCKESYE